MEKEGNKSRAISREAQGRVVYNGCCCDKTDCKTGVIFCGIFVLMCPTCPLNYSMSLHKKPSIHQVTTVLATSKNVLFTGHNHLLTTGTANPSLLAGTQEIIKVSGYQERWLAGGYNLEIGHF